jgi:hypothetical protein
VVVREWNDLDLGEKLDVLRQMWLGQTLIGLNNLSILCENGLASPDDIEDFAEQILTSFENFEVGDAADIIRFRKRLENLMVEVRKDLEGND